MPVIPAFWDIEAGRPPEVRNLRPAWPTWWNPISTKNTKISWVWWRTPIIPATRDAGAGELLEPRRQRLQRAEIAPLHSSLAPGDRVTLSLIKEKKITQLQVFCYSRTKQTKIPHNQRIPKLGPLLLGAHQTYASSHIYHICNWFILA